MLLVQLKVPTRLSEHHPEAADPIDGGFSCKRAATIGRMRARSRR